MTQANSFELTEMENTLQDFPKVLSAVEASCPNIVGGTGARLMIMPANLAPLSLRQSGNGSVLEVIDPHRR